LNKDGKQLGLFKTSDQAFALKEANTAQRWKLNEKTGKFSPTNTPIGRLELVPKKPRRFCKIHNRELYPDNQCIDHGRVLTEDEIA
jgi:hypothetical protein